MSSFQKSGRMVSWRNCFVLPYGPLAAIPSHLQAIEWRYFATAEADDRIIGLPAGEVEVALANDGYVVVTARVSDRA